MSLFARTCMCACVCDVAFVSVGVRLCACVCGVACVCVFCVFVPASECA